MAQNESCTTKQTFCELGYQTVSESSLSFNYNPLNLQNTPVNTSNWNNIINKIVEIYNYGTRGSRNPGINMGTWKKNNTGWWFEYLDGSYPTNSWIYEAGSYCHFNNEGYYDIRQTTHPGGSVTYILGPFSLDLTQPANTMSGNETFNSAIVSQAKTKSKHQAANNYIPLSGYNEILNALNMTPLNNLSDLSITAEKFNSIKNTINNIAFNLDRCNDCNVKCNTACEASDQGGGDCYCQSGNCFGCTGEGSCGECYGGGSVCSKQ